MGKCLFCDEGKDRYLVEELGLRSCQNHLGDLLAFIRVKWGSPHHVVIDLEVEYVAHGAASRRTIIEKLAAAIWARNGRRSGQDHQNWVEAERLLNRPPRESKLKRLIDFEQHG